MPPSETPSGPPAPGGPERYLRVDHLGADLRGRSVRGGAVTISNQGLKFIVTLGSTATLARLLTPEDFGLIAMVIAIVGFIGTFKDLGLAMATVQRPDINHGQVSTLFWVNLGVSVLVMAAFAALAPVFAGFYKEPRVLNIARVLSGTIIFGGLTVQHQALLRRQMRFGALALIEMTAMLLSFGAAVTAALLGLGYWSLVLIPVVREICTTGGVWLSCGWRPGKPVRRSGVRRMLAFGAHLTGFNIFNYMARNADKVLIGWHWGATPLGIYNKAYQLLLLPIQQINVPLTSVAVPTLSRVQHQLERYRAFYRRGVLLTVTAGMPIVAFLFVDADRAVLTLLGDQWGAAVPIFRVLSPAAFIGTFNVATGWVYISLGNTRRQFTWGIFASLCTVLAFGIGFRWGPFGIGAAFSAALIVLRLPSIIYCFRPTHLRLADLGGALWRPAVASIAAGAALFGLRLVVPLDMPIIVALAIDFVFYFMFYTLVWILLPGGMERARDMARLLQDIRPRSHPR